MPERESTEDLRSSIWTVSGEDLVKFFVLYTFIYIGGSACVAWFQIARAAAPHEVVSGIITGVSLIGVGVAPSSALVLIETWRLMMIFSRALERTLEERRQRRIKELEDYEQDLINQGIAIGEQRGYQSGYEKGKRDALAKMNRKDAVAVSNPYSDRTD